MADEERRTDEAQQFTSSRAHGKFLTSQIRRNERAKNGISLDACLYFHFAALSPSTIIANSECRLTPGQ
jgi:hypothetical protein